ncbi:hypothetical protein NQ318_018890 [Aromia moschata]|uniref:Uncharacterized protein n=1 Tax=Aromia moschata TaxID=1265417 RepID=A0AAV8ZGE8_9CUCU|nr:hypothetical protein NQ318_018890 [Aromia moschata]
MALFRKFFQKTPFARLSLLKEEKVLYSLIRKDAGHSPLCSSHCIQQQQQYIYLKLEIPFHGFCLIQSPNHYVSYILFFNFRCLIPHAKIILIKS